MSRLILPRLNILRNTPAIITILATTALLSACPRPAIVPPDDTDRPLGETSFVSADGSAGNRGGDFGLDDVAEPGAPPVNEGDGERTVEEGDIYRVLPDNLIANLNAYRGLQLIDFNDVDNPHVVGRLQISGTPVEMYVDDDMVYVLMNNWRGYYGARDEVALQQREGGVALAVDISDPNNPVEVDRAFIPGNIETSRLTKLGAAAALYVVTSGWAEWQDDNGGYAWESRTVVKSFDLSARLLTAKTDLDLGGYVADIQATPSALIVARSDWETSDAGSLVSLIDISDPGGVMIEGDQIIAAGWVRSQFNLDLHGEVLRIVSSGAWNGSETNHLETFDASDLDNLLPLDHVTFGDGEDLYATLFVDNKAFFVTYFRVDPFHAFSIDDAGNCEEQAEYVVSGWNDFFKPTFDDTRLVGIGINDEGGQTLSVSLYDITDLSNAEPLLARADVEADQSWSEANWDHRAFSVLQNVTSIAALSDASVVETGMVLLPFTGWSASDQTYTAAVQIFTFSETTLTRRGLMVHGTPVRRSFQPDDDLTANLSEAELSLFSTSDPDAPAALGTVELAPNYTEVFALGDYRARLKNSVDNYGYWWGEQGTLPPSRIDIIAADQHPDTAIPVAGFDVPADAQLYQSGSLLVAVRYVVEQSAEPNYQTHVTVYDLSDPTVPVEAGTLVTDQIQPSGGGWYGEYPGLDCFDCGYQPSYRASPDVQAFTGGLVFLERNWTNELEGTEESCTTWVDEPGCGGGSVDVSPPPEDPDEERPEDPGETNPCEGYYTGSVTCQSLNGGTEVCTGGILYCAYAGDGTGEVSCEEVDVQASSVNVETRCATYERTRSWTWFSVEVLALDDPSAPALAETILLPETDEGVSIQTNDDTAWVSTRRPEAVVGDGHAYVRYFIRPIDLASPRSPVVGDLVNVPGELLAVTPGENGTDLFTRDQLWVDDVIVTAVHRLALTSSVATLVASHVFEDQWVQSLTLDDAGHVLASHRQAWGYGWTDSAPVSESNSEDNSEPDLQQLTVLDADDLAVLAAVDIDSWANLREAVAGRALFEVPGGLLVFNLDDAAAPAPQAYFATRGWPSHISIDGREVIFAAGRYGVYAFDLDAYNLLTLQ